MGKVLGYACALSLLAGCAGSGGVFSASIATATAYSGYVAVASSTTNTITLYDRSGVYVRTLRDLNSPSSELPIGLLPSSTPGEILAGIYGIGRIEKLSLANSAYSPLILNTTLSTAYPRGLARDAQGNFLLSSASGWTIEKFSPAGFRIGAPFIPTIVGGCTLSNPYGVTVLGDGAIVAGNASASGLEIYEPGGTCRLHLNSAPFNANYPRTVAYDPLHGKLIVAFYSNGSIYSVNYDGSGATEIYRDANVIQNPTAIAVDASGIIYVGSSTQNSVEKLSFDGTVATRVGAVPFIGASAATLSPAAITVVP